MKRILFLTQGDETNASSRHRVYQYLPLLEKAGWDAVVSPALTAAEYKETLSKHNFLTNTKQYWRIMMRRFRDLHHLGEFDKIFVQRPILPAPWPFIEKSIARQKPFIFDFEEALYLPAETSTNLWDHQRQTQRISDICQIARKVIGANEILADFARGHGTESHVIRMAIDFKKADEAVANRKPNPTFTIGWFGGTMTQRFLRPLFPILKSLHQKVSFDLKIVSGFPPKTVHPFPVEWVPWNLETENQHLASFDLGLAPIPDTPRNRIRTSYRVLQYLAHNVPVIASPVGIQAGELKEGQDIIFARSPEEWSEKIIFLMKDEAYRRKLAENGRQCVREHHDLPLVFNKLIKILDAG